MGRRKEPYLRLAVVFMVVGRSSEDSAEMVDLLLIGSGHYLRISW